MVQADPLELVSEAQRAWWSRLGEIAQAVGARAWLVGGPVRDLLLGCQCPDTDLAVEGDVEALAQAMAAELGGRVRKTTQFMTATVALPSGEAIDLAHTRTEVYPKPGALPTVAAAGLEEDLARRDFTVNAMAVALNPDQFGRLVDPHGGRADLQARLLRVLHERSFEDDPTRLLRAARFAYSLGLELEEHTAELMGRAVAERRLLTISRARVRNELRRLFADLPGTALEALQRWELTHALGWPAAPERALARSRELPRAAQALGLTVAQLQPLPASLGLYAAEAGLEPTPLAERLGLDARETAALQRTHELLTETPAAVAGGSDSELYFALEQAPGAAVAALWTAATPSVRERLQYYWRQLRRTRSDVTGVDLIAAGCLPGPGFAAALRAALRAKLDDGAGRDQQLRAALEAFGAYDHN